MTAEIHLRNAIFKGRDRGLARPVVEIHGTIEHRDGGLEVVVTEALDERGKPVETPWSRIFLPMSKVDHYIPTDA